MPITKVFPRMEFEIVRCAQASHQTWRKKLRNCGIKCRFKIEKTISFSLWPGAVSFWHSFIVILFFPDKLVIKMLYSSKKKIKISYHIHHHHPELRANPEQNCPNRSLMNKLLYQIFRALRYSLSLFKKDNL